MPRNPVQLQKGMSDADFYTHYGTEEQCRAAIFTWRWPDGFVCPVCGGGKHSVITSRATYQCSACRFQASLTAGTIFHSTKLPLLTWFRAIFHMTQNKGGISSLELARRLGVTQNTAWKIFHKIMPVMHEREEKKPLKGRVAMDDAYLGGKRKGKRGCGASRKTAFLAAAETTNVKSAIVGTYRAINPKHIPRYLSSFVYRFNRRFHLPDLFTRLVYVAIRTPPMPYRLLKLAEDGA